MDLRGVMAYLQDHIDLETHPPTADTTGRAGAERRFQRARRLLEVSGDPQRSYPVIQLTGTNGKGSTARILTALLTARGLSVGTYTSPHLERINERLAWNGDPISDDDLVRVIEDIAGLEVMLDEPPSHFEILTAAAYRWFADVAVDVAVVEVGLGGRYDATNVADAEVAVVTNVSLDHEAIIGPGLTDIAEEKAGIVKPGSSLVLGETDPELASIFEAAGAASVWNRDHDFGCDRNRLAHDGRAIDLYTPNARYPDLFLPLHGAYQGDNAAAAVAAAEAFFGAPLHADVVSSALHSVRVPGRMEVVGRRPLCVLDGAHNVAGAVAAAEAVDETFQAVSSRVMVVGMLRGRDPQQMLQALGAEQYRLVVTCPPPSPRALAADTLGAAARELGLDVEVCESVPGAVEAALARAASDELVLVTGSLYVVGAARAELAGASQ